jgi:ADP-ribose pyrophosphatase YjhB (NUDIX family)
VGIAVIRVVKDGREGILIVRRGHEPKRGEWALPGGHIECGEQIVDAIVRELREETGLVLAPDALEAWRAASNPAGTHILIFATLVAAAPIPFENVAFTPSDEVLEVGVMYDKDFPLAYPLHQEAAQREFIWILE